MKIKLNGESYETDAANLKELFTETHSGQDRAGKAIAVNGEVIPSSDWDEFTLSESDKIEIIQAVQGG